MVKMPINADDLISMRHQEGDPPNIDMNTAMQYTFTEIVNI